MSIHVTSLDRRRLISGADNPGMDRVSTEATLAQKATAEVTWIAEWERLRAFLPAIHELFAFTDDADGAPPAWATHGYLSAAHALEPDRVWTMEDDVPATTSRTMTLTETADAADLTWTASATGYVRGVLRGTTTEVRRRSSDPVSWHHAAGRHDDRPDRAFQLGKASNRFSADGRHLHLAGRLSRRAVQDRRRRDRRQAHLLRDERADEHSSVSSSG